MKRRKLGYRAKAKIVGSLIGAALMLGGWFFGGEIGRGIVFTLVVAAVYANSLQHDLRDHYDEWFVERDET
jgi:hypothetical protein